MRELRMFFIAALMGVATVGCAQDGTVDRSRQNLDGLTSVDSDIVPSREDCDTPADPVPSECADAVRERCAEANVDEKTCQQWIDEICDAIPCDPGDPNGGCPPPPPPPPPPEDCADVVLRYCAENDIDKATCQELLQRCEEPTPCDPSDPNGDCPPPPPPPPPEDCIEAVRQFCAENGIDEATCQEYLDRCTIVVDPGDPCDPTDPPPPPPPPPCPGDPRDPGDPGSFPGPRPEEPPTPGHGGERP